MLTARVQVPGWGMERRGLRWENSKLAPGSVVFQIPVFPPALPATIFFRESLKSILFYPVHSRGQTGWSVFCSFLARARITNVFLNTQVLTSLVNSTSLHETLILHAHTQIKINTYIVRWKHQKDIRILFTISHVTTSNWEKTKDQGKS